MEKIPAHVSIIMDGNGRWARKSGHQRLFGHNQGVESVRACCEAAIKNKVKYLSLFAFSQENWSRPKEEVMGLMELMLRSLMGERDTFRTSGTKVLVKGDRSNLSQELIESIEMVEKETENNSVLTLVIFMSYSGKWDIIQACERYAKDILATQNDPREIPPLDARLFESYLATSGIPDPDLLIRTSGEQRLSNFLLWQCAYTEFYYTDVLWPDFGEAEFVAALESYKNRERRYGLIK